MLYQSVRESAALFEKKLKQRQTYQQVQVFRWKFIVLGLGVILVILIGICSQLIKTISSRKQIPINTTFLSSLLSSSQFFNGDISVLRELVKSLEDTEDIRFDNATLLFRGNRTSGEAISKIISGHGDLLVLLEIVDGDNPDSIRKLGMFLHEYLPKLDYKTDTVTSIADRRDSLTSTIFNLQYTKNQHLNKTQSCYLYTYNPSAQQLSLIQLLHFGEEAINSEINIMIDNYLCFEGDRNVDREKVRMKVGEIIGFGLGEATKRVVLRKMEVFWLEMSGIDFGQVKVGMEEIREI